MNKINRKHYFSYRSERDERRSMIFQRNFERYKPIDLRLPVTPGQCPNRKIHLRVRTGTSHFWLPNCYGTIGPTQQTKPTQYLCLNYSGKNTVEQWANG